MSRTRVKTTAEYAGHPVIAGEFKDFKYNHNHLKNNLALMQHATARHNKVLTWRMDVHLPQNMDNDPKKFIKSFMSSYTNKLSRMGLDPDYAVKMEQQSSDSPHWHIQMFADGNKTKDYRPHVQYAEELIAEQLNLSTEKAKGLVHYCNKGQDGTRLKNGIMIRRNSDNFQEQFDQVHKQMSYLAKHKSNDIIPEGQRKMNYSRYNRDKCRSIS